MKHAAPGSSWVWGAFKLTGAILRRLHSLWLARDRRDVYVGTLVNAYIAEGGLAWGVAGGGEYIDVGTIHGYRRAVGMLAPPHELGAADN